MQDQNLPTKPMTHSAPSRHSQSFTIQKYVDIVDATMVDRIGPHSVRRTGVFQLPIRAATQR